MESHPTIPGFTQCVTKGFFKDMKWMENLYNTGTLCLFYFIPLVFIVVCYAMIIKNIGSSDKSTTGSKSIGNNNSTQHSSSQIVRKHRFRIRTPTFSNTDNTISGSIASGSMKLNQLSNHVDLKTASKSPNKSNQIMIKSVEQVSPKNKGIERDGSKLMKNESGKSYIFNPVFFIAMSSYNLCFYI